MEKQIISFAKKGIPMKYFYRFNKDVLAYNAIAKEVMQERNIKIIDLYSFTEKFGKDAFEDHVHYKEAIREKQAEFISKNKTLQAHSG